MGAIQAGLAAAEGRRVVREKGKRGRENDVWEPSTTRMKHPSPRSVMQHGDWPGERMLHIKSNSKADVFCGHLVLLLVLL